MTKLIIFLAIATALQVVIQGAPVVLKDICNTPQCKKAAEIILADLQQDIDPCEDFDQFACGGYYKRSEIPDDSSGVTTWNDAVDRNRDIIRSFVDPNDPNAPKPDTNDEAANRNIRRMQTFYTGCINQDQIEKAGRQPMVNLVRELVKTFPVADSVLQQHNDSTTKRATLPDDKIKSISTLIGQYGARDISSPLGFDVYAGLQNPKNNILYIMTGQTSTTLSGPEYLDKNKTDSLEAIISKMFYLIEDVHPSNQTQIPDKWTQVAKEVIAFEQTLANVTLQALIRGTTTNIANTIPTSNLTQRSPSLDWDIIFENLLPEGVNKPSEVVDVYPGYIEDLNGLLENTPSRALQYYFAWRNIVEYGTELSQQYSEPLVQYQLIAPKPKPRELTCLDNVDTYLGGVIGHYYIKATFTEKIRATITDMVDAIHKRYVTRFKQYDWFDAPTLKEALEKLQKMTAKIGYSNSYPDVSSATSVDDFYSDLKLDETDYFGNFVRSKTLRRERRLAQSNKPVDKEYMLDDAQTINAYYDRDTNAIIIPAGFLQRPLFNMGDLDFLNYAAIGTIIGHEITHGFDSARRYFDSEGVFREWFSNETAAAFEAKSQCFVEQYGNFTVEGPDGTEHNVDGALTLSENISDNGGIKASFETIFQSTTGSTPNQALPGLEKYTAEQLFFIRYSNVWCVKTRPEAYKHLLADTHAPGKYRINGVAQNSEHFAKAFQCKPGTKMNPVKKCDLW
ncbi:hypothetical protein BGZ76_008792 [Entomortierella beljakovae]|nr:hypothetical protein BGZ76_008792 [Entomortierella beljakovae]